MKLRQDQAGSVALVVSLVVTVVLLIGALGFSFWAFSGRQDYKNNVDQKVAVAVAEAKQSEANRKDKEFAEISKSPLKSYIGPSDFGSINLLYPKTWSGYVAASNERTPFIDGYFNPGVVPSVDEQESTFALRIRVSSDSYSEIMSNYQSSVEEGTVKVSAYRLKKVPKVIGSKVVGEIDNEVKGTRIVLPLRANTLEIWTESDKFLEDFNKYILPNISFSP